MILKIEISNFKISMMASLVHLWTYKTNKNIRSKPTDGSIMTAAHLRPKIKW